jgi:hypothetical protein
MRAQLTYAQGQFAGLRTAIPKFKRDHYDCSVRLFRGAVAAFVMATAAQVHVDTGMSAASLKPLGKKVGANFTITPKTPKGRFWGTYMTGKSYRSKIRNMAEGIKAGQKAGTINYGTFPRPIMSFSFSIKVYQYWYWEAIRWQSLMAGEWAFKNYIKQNYESMVGAPLKKQLRIAFKIGEKRG